MGVLEQIAEAVWRVVRPDHSTVTDQGLVTGGWLRGLAELLAASGPIFVVGVINGVLDPQPLRLLHIGPLLGKGHGFPGFTYRTTTSEF